MEKVRKPIVWSVLVCVGCLLSTATVVAGSDDGFTAGYPEQGAVQHASPTTVDPGSVEEPEGDYVQLKILDGVPVVSGTSPASSLSQIGRALGNRCAASVPVELRSLPAKMSVSEHASHLVAQLDCAVSAMSVTILEDGSLIGVVGVADESSFDRLREVLPEGIEVFEDYPD